VDEIAPSTPLAPYTRQYCALFLGPISRLAPGALPPVRISQPIYYACLLSFLVGLFCLVFGGFFRAYFIAMGGLLLAVTGYVGSWFAARITPASVRFGELRTFRDLAVVIARGNSAGTLGERKENRK
jgi:hypothetical protein